jgi:hypothetical protein
MVNLLVSISGSTISLFARLNKELFGGVFTAFGQGARMKPICPGIHALVPGGAIQIALPPRNEAREFNAALRAIKPPGNNSLRCEVRCYVGDVIK